MPVDEVLANHVVPMVLAALVPDVVQPLIVGHSAGIVDRLKLDRTVNCLRYISYNVESRQHWELLVVLTSERPSMVVWGARRWRRWRWRRTVIALGNPGCLGP